MTTNHASPPSAVVDALSEGVVNDERPPPDLGIMDGGGEMGALMRSMDWSQSAFGPVERWSQALRSAVSICLTTRFAVVLYYGPELALIYNDARRPVVGNKHPWSFGCPGHEVWDIIGPMFDTVMATGEVTWSDDQLPPLNRFGYVEECYFYYSYSLIRGAHDKPEGIFTAVTETTLRVVLDRRTRLLRDLAARSVEAKTAAVLYALAGQTLREDPHDIAFALIYALTPDGQARHLASEIGPELGPYRAPARVATGYAAVEDKATWSMAEVVRTSRSVVIEGSNETMPGLPGGPWPEPLCQPTCCR